MRRDSSVVDLNRPAREGARAPLADLTLEAQVIGAVLENDQTFKYCTDLTVDAFSDPAHAEVWTEVCSLIESGRRVTTSTLAASYGPERLETIGGREFLANLAREGRTLSGQLDEAVTRLRDLMVWRRLEALQGQLGEWIGRRPGSANEILAAVLREADAIVQLGHAGARSKKDVARAALEQARVPREPSRTGIESLDWLMNGGLIPTRMYGVGAETGIGKTVLLGSISENLNTQGRRHLHISLETPSEDIEIRNVARRMNVNAAQIYDSDQPEHQHVVNNADAYIAQVPDNTFFEWAPGATYDDIRRYIVHAIHKHGIEGVIIDYWQLIRGRERGQSEEGHMRDVANRLAALARRENIWILIAVQVDESGRVKISDSIKLACALYVRLMRAPNDTTAYFHTEKSNYTRLTDTGSASTPGMIFHHHGPHFGTPSPEDMTQIGDTPADAIDV